GRVRHARDHQVDVSYSFHLHAAGHPLRARALELAVHQALIQREIKEVRVADVYQEPGPSPRADVIDLSRQVDRVTHTARFHLLDEWSRQRQPVRSPTACSLAPGMKDDRKVGVIWRSSDARAPL